METIGNPWLWSGFAVVVVVALLVDLVLMRHGGAHKVTFKEAAWWSLGWVAVALLFNAGLWWYLTETAGSVVANRVGLEFLTGYLVEKSLAVDNIFVFLMLFTYFAVPEEQRQRVLVIGILGAIVLRAILIFVGAALLAKFHWLLYIFGAFLLITGVKMWWFAEQTPDLANNPVIRWIRKHMNVSDELHGERFFITREVAGKAVRYVTPLFLVLVLVELSDVIFAVDSIPAIFAITTDPFIVFTSNIFAILGLRAMYFMLAGLADRFHLLKYGLAMVLVFVGAKMLAADVYHVPVGLSLGIVALIIATFMFASLWVTRKRS